MRPSHGGRSLLSKAVRPLHPKSFACREYNDSSFDDFREEIQNERDFLDSFLEDNESSSPCWNTKVIQRFCETRTGTKAVRAQPEIWLDDRERGSNKSRQYPEVLTVDELRQHLELPRFGVANLANADYRQIRIHNLNPASLLAIARTSACHQVDTLRDTFAKHISGATSLRVYERVIGFVTPRLELHLPYLTLREVSSSSNQWKGRDPKAEAESWLDLPLPDSDSKTTDGPNRFFIEKSHISLVLCIWDYSKWVGYAFSKGGPTPTSEKETDAGNELDREASDEEDNEDDCAIPKEDIFAPRGVEHGLYAEYPIRDPRVYFLRVFDVWIAFVLHEYTYLVGVLQECVASWQKQFRCAITEVSYDEPQQSVTQLSNSIVKMSGLLRHVKSQLALATRAWKEFSGRDGDISYFSDIRNTHGRLYIKSIKASFRELVNHEGTLSALVIDCAVSAKNLKLRMELESRYLNLESNRMNLDTIEVQRQVHLTNKENNELQRQAYITNTESTNIQRQTYSVNLETQCISREMQQLTLDMQGLNRENNLTAQSTSKTTRTNVLMIWITTPFFVALQYFSADQPIFTSFERSPRNFGISLCILGLALPLSIWIINVLYGVVHYIVPRLCLKKSRNGKNVEDSSACSQVLPVATGV